MRYAAEFSDPFALYSNTYQSISLEAIKPPDYTVLGALNHTIRCTGLDFLQAELKIVQQGLNSVSVKVNA